MAYDHNILIVDDNPATLRLANITLKKYGFLNIKEAKDGQQAIKELTKGNIDLILSDWNMPKISGLQLLQAVKKNNAYKEIYFIMITAQEKKDAIIEAINAGADAYIIKPYPSELLFQKIADLLHISAE